MLKRDISGLVGGDQCKFWTFEGNNLWWIFYDENDNDDEVFFMDFLIKLNIWSTQSLQPSQICGWNLSYYERIRFLRPNFELFIPWEGPW